MMNSLNWPSVVSACGSKLRYFGRILLRDKMPVWLVLVGILFGATVTYLVAPILNSRFEVAKARAAYVTENLKGLNTDTANLFALLATANLEIASTQEISKSTRTDFAKAVVMLQWRANEYEILFPDDQSLGVIRRYSAGIDSVRQTVLGGNTQATPAQIREAAAKLAASTRDMIGLLSQKSEWSRSFRVL